MDLRTTINGVQYDILQGATFAEEFNETLDSGSIIISGVEKIKGLKPYDDVYIYSFNNKNYKFKGYPFDEDNIQPKFYKHLLVDQFTEEVLRLGDSEEEGRYKYKIELMSETKKLETIQLPNISITQPIVGKKTSVWEYINRFVELYSPVYKILIEGTTKWEYKKKYSVSDTLKPIFEKTYSPDFVLNTPTLRALISKLLLVKDVIPYVKDDVIYGMDISKRYGKFDINPNYVNIITGSMTSDNYCDNLRRNYSDALSKERTCRSVEYVGFRNSDNALMTISNMRLELGMPIYKINRVLLCYYKKIRVDFDGTNRKDEGTKDAVILCKQDITKLIKLNTERNLLSQDWEDLHESNVPRNVDDMSKFKFCTVGYDMGSKYITGWGERYTYPAYWNDNIYTTIQNIAAKMDYFYPFGIYDSQYVASQFAQGATIYSALDSSFLMKLIDKNIENNTNKSVSTFFETVYSPFSNASLSLKGLFFIVDYEGFYNGVIVHSKHNDRDDIVINDNATETLTLIEQDAIYQNEKVNRFGNKALQINARYDKFYNENGEENIQALGSVYNSSYEDDVIIYHREYSIYNNSIQCIYYGIKNYVLKNWFTSVYAKYRTWSLMPYNESVKRSENIKEYIYWSDSSIFYEEDSNNIFKNYADEQDWKYSYIQDLISCVNSWDSRNICGVYQFKLPKQINTAYLYFCKEDGSCKSYASDLNAFIANNSLCFNIKMFDNFSQGVYISEPEPFSDGKARDVNGTFLTDWVDKPWEWLTTSGNADYSGSRQDFYPIIDSSVTGETKTLGFYVGHKPDNSKIEIWETFPDGAKTFIEAIQNFKQFAQRFNNAYNYLFKLPDISSDIIEEKIGIYQNFYKDNKSYIDTTLQIENINKVENLILSPWVLKLSDLMGDYPKFDRNVTKKDQVVSGTFWYYVSQFCCPYGVKGQTLTPTYKTSNFFPVMTIKFTNDVYEAMIDNFEYDMSAAKMTFVFCKDYNAAVGGLEFHNVGGEDVVLLDKFTVKTMKLEQKTLLRPASLTLKGTLTFGYKPAGSATTSKQENKGFTIRLFKHERDLRENGTVDNAIAGSMMPNGVKKQEGCGKNADFLCHYFSSAIDATYSPSASTTYKRFSYNDVYGSNGYYPYPYINMSQGVAEDYDPTTITDTTTVLPGPGRFCFVTTDENGTKSSHILSTYYPGSGDDSLWRTLVGQVCCNIAGEEAYRRGTKNLPWEDLSLFDLPTIVKTAPSTFSEIKYAIYYKNMFLRLSENFVTNEDKDSEYLYGELPENSTYTVTNHIKVKHSVLKGTYIEIKFPETNPNLKSISFYYLDDKNAYKVSVDSMGFVTQYKYVPDNCYYHFVFGVNIPENWDRSQPYRIYLSRIAKKDMRVFDKYHQEVAKSLNYVDYPNAYALGENFSDYDISYLPDDNVSEFESLPWETIKTITNRGLAPALWNLGRTKTFTGKSGKIYTVRIVDMKYNRYNCLNGKATNMVLEFVECVNLDGETLFEEGLDFDNQYIGSTLQTAVLKNIFDDLPDDLQAVIAEVNIDVYNNTSLFKFENPISTAGKLFLPSVSELTLSYGSNNFINTVMEYYIGDTAEARRIKSEKYWTRDCYYSNVPAMSFATLYYVDTDGGITPRFDSGVARKAGVAPFFAI